MNLSTERHDIMVLSPEEGADASLLVRPGTWGLVCPSTPQGIRPSIAPSSALNSCGSGDLESYLEGFVPETDGQAFGFWDPSSMVTTHFERLCFRNVFDHPCP